MQGNDVTFQGNGANPDTARLKDKPIKTNLQVRTVTIMMR